MINLDGKVVVITGASSGIGAALAQAFSSRGAKVTLAARRLNRLEQVARGCTGEVLIVAADLVKERDRNAVLERTIDRWGRIDVLVNNAGIGIYGHFMTTTEEDWRKIFEINLFATVFLTQTVLPIMRAQGEGLVINVASIGGLIAHSERVAPYVASKHAIIGFSRGLVRDLNGTGVRVLAVCPHLTATELFAASLGAEEMAPVIEKHRNFMDTPEEVARGVLKQLDSNRLVVFPTTKAARSYDKQKDI
jgi:short-subunit dehydrogenase